MPPTAAPRIPSVESLDLLKDGKSKEEVGKLSWADVKARNLLVISGKAYDASSYLSTHPGGAVLATYLGSDATDIFRAFHAGSKRSVNDLSALLVGEVATSTLSRSGTKAVVAQSPFEQEVRELAAKLAAAGLYKPDLYYYAGLVARTAALGAAAAALALWAGPGAIALKLVAAVILAVFWQQSGWLAHDFAHNQVFADRRINAALVIIFGNVWLGFSLQWWKDKHNLHHAVPNLHPAEPETKNGDPDIDTLPYLAWSRAMLARVAPTRLGRAIVSMQAYMYFPLLLFARAIWGFESISYVLRQPAAGAHVSGERWTADRPLMHPWAERAGLAAHWACLAGLLWASCGSVAEAAAFFAVSQCTSGLLLALAFGVGHNGMEVFDDDAARPAFAELQVRTTRDVVNTPFNAWFMGGLHFQIEHHLFPTMPRHHLAAAAPFVRDLCRKHNVPYHCTGLWEGTREVLAHLSDVASALAEHGPL